MLLLPLLYGRGAEATSLVEARMKNKKAGEHMVGNCMIVIAIVDL